MGEQKQEGGYRKDAQSSQPQDLKEKAPAGHKSLSLSLGDKIKKEIGDSPFIQKTGENAFIHKIEEMILGADNTKKHKPEGRSSESLAVRMKNIIEESPLVQKIHGHSKGAEKKKKKKKQHQDGGDVDAGHCELEEEADTVHEEKTHGSCEEAEKKHDDDDREYAIDEQGYPKGLPEKAKHEFKDNPLLLKIEEMMIHDDMEEAKQHGGNDTEGKHKEEGRLKSLRTKSLPEIMKREIEDNPLLHKIEVKFHAGDTEGCNKHEGDDGECKTEEEGHILPENVQREIEDNVLLHRTEEKFHGGTEGGKVREGDDDDEEYKMKEEGHIMPENVQREIEDNPLLHKIEEKFYGDTEGENKHKGDSGEYKTAEEGHAMPANVQREMEDNSSPHKIKEKFNGDMEEDKNRVGNNGKCKTEQEGHTLPQDVQRYIIEGNSLLHKVEKEKFHVDTEGGSKHEGDDGKYELTNEEGHITPEHVQREIKDDPSFQKTKGRFHDEMEGENKSEYIDDVESKTKAERRILPQKVQSDIQYNPLLREIEEKFHGHDGVGHKIEEESHAKNKRAAGKHEEDNDKIVEKIHSQKEEEIKNQEEGNNDEDITKEDQFQNITNKKVGDQE